MILIPLDNIDDKMKKTLSILMLMILAVIPMAAQQYKYELGPLLGISIFDIS